MKKILYIQYTNPAVYPPLEHSSRILADNDWSVLFLGVGLSGDYDFRFPSHSKIEVRQLPFCKAGWYQKLHYIGFVLWTVVWVLRWRPQWVYASDLLSCPSAVIISLIPGIKVIYHEHDTPSTTQESKFIRLCLFMRNKLARRSEICILPNHHRANSFSQDTLRKDVFCVWNCPSQEEIPILSTINKDSNIWVFYHGSIVPDRLPPTILMALTKLPDIVKLRVIGYETVVHKGYVLELKEIANQLGIDSRVEFLGDMPTRQDLLKWCQKSHIGLALMPRHSDDLNMQHMTGASNKPFDYLACGLPLLVSDLPDWKDIFVEPGYGLACNPEDPDSIAAALHWFVENPDEMRRMGENGHQQVVTKWCYEFQFAEILKHLNMYSFSNLSICKSSLDYKN
jgi:glycosyltransferase involved in cell wall biosynthesis